MINAILDVIDIKMNEKIAEIEVLSSKNIKNLKKAKAQINKIEKCVNQPILFKRKLSDDLDELDKLFFADLTCTDREEFLFHTNNTIRREREEENFNFGNILVNSPPTSPKRMKRKEKFKMKLEGQDLDLRIFKNTEDTAWDPQRVGVHHRLRTELPQRENYLRDHKLTSHKVKRTEFYEAHYKELVSLKINRLINQALKIYS